MRQIQVSPGQETSIEGPIYGIRWESPSPSALFKIDGGELRSFACRGSEKPPPGKPWKRIQIYNDAFGGLFVPTGVQGVYPYWDDTLYALVADNVGEDVDGPIAPTVAYPPVVIFGKSFSGAQAGAAPGTPSTSLNGDGTKVPYSSIVTPSWRITSRMVGGYMRLRLRDPDLGSTGTQPRTVVLWEGKINPNVPEMVWSVAAGGPITLVPFTIGPPPAGNSVQDFLVSGACDAMTICPVDVVGVAAAGATPTFIDVQIASPSV